MKPSTTFFKVIRIFMTSMAILILSSCVNIPETPTPANTETNTDALLPTETLVQTSAPEPTEEGWILHTTEQLPDATIDEVLTELTVLEQTSKNFLSQSGWHHTIIESAISSVPGQREYDFEVYGWDSSQMEPPIQTRETWLKMANSCCVMGNNYLSIISNVEGTPVQLTACNTLGEGCPLSLPELSISECSFKGIDLNWLIGKIIKQLDQVRPYDHKLRAGFITGEYGIEYVIDLAVGAQDDLFDFDWLPEPVNGFTLLYRIDAKTGIILEFTENDINASKEIFRGYSETMLVSEFVESMPQDIQDLYIATLDRCRELLEGAEE